VARTYTCSQAGRKKKEKRGKKKISCPRRERGESPPGSWSPLPTRSAGELGGGRKKERGPLLLLGFAPGRERKKKRRGDDFYSFQGSPYLKPGLCEVEKKKRGEERPPLSAGTMQKEKEKEGGGRTTCLHPIPSRPGPRGPREGRNYQLVYQWREKSLLPTTSKNTTPATRSTVRKEKEPPYPLLGEKKGEEKGGAPVTVPGDTFTLVSVPAKKRGREKAPATRPG